MTIEKIKKYIDKMLFENNKLLYFHLDEMDNHPDYKNYHHREYLICYYKKQMLIDLLNYIESEDEK